MALPAGLAGAAAWGVGLTVAQPLSEPAKPWPRSVVTTENMYWARDFRWAAIMVVLMSLLLSARGDRSISAIFTAGAVGWLGLDTWLDRIDFGGATSELWAIGLAGAVVAGLWLLVLRREVVPSRPTLLFAAAICAAVAPMAALTTGPDDIDPLVLTQLSLALSLLLSALAFACALSSASRFSRGRLVAAVFLALLVFLQVARVQQASPDSPSFVGVLTLGSLLFSVVALAAGGERRAHGDREHGARARLGRLAVLVGAAATYPVLFTETFGGAAGGVGAALAEMLTRLAGNPVVNSADTDSINALTGVITGVLFGLLVLSAPRIRWHLDESARLAAAERQRRFPLVESQRSVST